MTLIRDAKIALGALVVGACVGGLVVSEYNPPSNAQPAAAQPSASVASQPVARRDEPSTAIAPAPIVSEANPPPTTLNAQPSPTTTVNGHPVKLPASVVEAARESASHQLVNEASFLQDVARKIKADPDPAIKEVFVLLRAGKPEPEVLDYIRTNIPDRLQSVMTVGMVKDFYHGSGKSATDSPLGSGGGPSLVPKPVQVTPPPTNPGGQGL